MDVMALRRSILAGNSFTLAEYTATGNPLSFETNIAKSLKSLVIPWTPTQSGTGDPSPENVRPISGVSGLTVCRTGINIFDGQLENGYINSSGEKSGTGSSYCRTVNYIPCSPDTEYYFYYVIVNTSNMKIYYYDKDKSYISSTWTNPQKHKTPANAYYIMFYMDSVYTAQSNRDIAINYPSSDTEYHPYTGQSYPITFPALGKNLLNPATLEQGGIDSDGSVFNTSKRVRSGYIPVEEGKKYISSAGTGTKAFMHFYNANKVSMGGNTPASSVSPEGAAFMRCIFGYNDETNVVPSDITEGQVVQSDSALPYEPYTNTVYGGSLDVTTGVLTVEYYLASFTKSKFGNKQTGNVGIEYRVSDYLVYPLPNSASGTNWVLAREQQIFNYGIIANPWGESEYGNNIGVIVTQSFGTTMRISESVYQAMSDTDTADISYKLDTPLTYQLTPQQVTALIGTNTIWSDTNGSNTAVYLKK